MKFFLACALLVTVASAGVVRDVNQIADIIAAIDSPNTDPATAQLLEQMLADLMGENPAAIPEAVVEEIENPAAIPEVVIDNVKPEKPKPIKPIGPGAIPPSIVADDVVPAPAPPQAPAAPGSSLVQIIVNVNGKTAPGVQPVAVIDNTPEIDSVVERPMPEPYEEKEVVPSPVIVVDEVEAVEPIQVSDPVLPSPVVVEPIVVADPVLPTPEVVEPIVVAEPELPVPVMPVNLPEELN